MDGNHVESAVRLGRTTFAFVLPFLTALSSLAASAQDAPVGSRLVVTGRLLAGAPAVGSVLGPDGETLAGVAVEVGGRVVLSDGAGHFVFSPESRSIGESVELRLNGAAGRGLGGSQSLAVVSGPLRAESEPMGSMRPQLTQVPAHPVQGRTMTLSGSGFLDVGDPVVETRVQIGSLDVPIRAATSAELVVSLPVQTPLGRQPLVVTGLGGHTAPVEVEVVRLDLSADQTELLRGQSSRVEIRVEGTTDSLPLRITNLTPRVITLEGEANSILVTSGGRENRASVTFRARRKGVWSVSAEPADDRKSVDDKVVDLAISPSLAEPPRTTSVERRFEDTGDVLVSGVPASGGARRREPAPSNDQDSSGSPVQSCLCLGCSTLEIQVTDRGVPAPKPLPVGSSLRFTASAVARCSDDCPAHVDGNWHLTFIPHAATAVPTFLQRSQFAPPPRGTTEPPLEIKGGGASLDFSPDRPGTIIARFLGRGFCAEARCDGPVRVASAELQVGYPPPSKADLERMAENVDRALPDIARAPGSKRPSAAAVARWFAATTGWRPGHRYLQSLVLPEDAVAVNLVRVVASGMINYQAVIFSDDPLSEGQSAEGATRVFGESATLGLALTRRDGRLYLDYDAPVVDQFTFHLSFVDHEGVGHDVSLDCPGTTSSGKPVEDPCRAPAGGVIRIAIQNVDPSRLDDIELEVGGLLDRIAAGFGGRSSLSGIGPAWDAAGRQSTFAHFRLDGVEVCPALLAPLLEELAASLGATVDLTRNFIVIKGSDFGEEGLIPPWLGGRLPPWAQR